MKSAVALACLIGWSCAHPVREPGFGGAAGPGAYSVDVRDGFTRARAATAAFHDPDSAAAAGYASLDTACYSDPTHGAMGYHHVNRAYMDGRVEVERPEILLYEQRDDGSYALNGVEYLVPYRVWPPDSVPPTLMGRDMLRSDNLKVWYSHMWIWTPNRAGLFADWNPAVRCRARRAPHP